jgi:hypothetical protein
VGQHGARENKRGIEIDRQDTVPQLPRSGGGGAQAVQYTRAVDQNVQVPPSLSDLLDGGLSRLIIGDIHSDAPGGCTGCGYLVGNGMDTTRDPIEDADLSTVPRQGERNRSPDPGSSASENDGATSQIEPRIPCR